MKSILLLWKMLFQFFAAFMCYLVYVMMKKSKVFCECIFLEPIQAHLPIEGGELFYSMIIQLFIPSFNKYILGSQYVIGTRLYAAVTDAKGQAQT